MALPAAPALPDPKRVALLEAALRCFGQSGFHATTTAQVAQRAQVATGSLFRYFATKDDLVHGAFTYARDLLCAPLVPGPDFPHDTVYDMLRRLWQALTQQALRHPQAFHYCVLYVGTPNYGAVASPHEPWLRPLRGAARLLTRATACTREQSEWLLVLWEAQWVASLRLLLFSGAADEANPWGGAVAEYAYHQWWAGVGLTRTQPWPADEGG